MFVVAVDAKSQETLEEINGEINGPRPTCLHRFFRLRTEVLSNMVKTAKRIHESFWTVLRNDAMRIICAK